jgi:predicted pyridoxine 5'-phosphate oxidase superfamily flavin-nucleotide-binding protein
MTSRYSDIAFTPSVAAAQKAKGNPPLAPNLQFDRSSDALTQAEMDFIAARDSFYLATVSETGWPYVQHRGGPAGFLRVLDDNTLAFADFWGNRQYISLGNLSENNRAALILMDYPRRRRLKIYARLEARGIGADAALACKLTLPGYKARPERAFLLHVSAFDWNCPQHITPRFTAAEIDAALKPMRDRVEQLEAENQALRAKPTVDGAHGAS